MLLLNEYGVIWMFVLVLNKQTNKIKHIKASNPLCIASRRPACWFLAQSWICTTFWMNMVQSGRLFCIKQTNKQKRIHVGFKPIVYSKQKACLLVFGTKPNMYDILSEHGAIWTWPWPIHHYYSFLAGISN